MTRKIRRWQAKESQLRRLLGPRDTRQGCLTVCLWWTQLTQLGICLGRVFLIEKIATMVYNACVTTVTRSILTPNSSAEARYMTITVTVRMRLGTSV